MFEIKKMSETEGEWFISQGTPFDVTPFCDDFDNLDELAFFHKAQVLESGTGKILRDYTEEA